MKDNMRFHTNNNINRACYDVNACMHDNNEDTYAKFSKDNRCRIKTVHSAKNIMNWHGGFCWTMTINSKKTPFKSRLNKGPSVTVKKVGHQKRKKKRHKRMKKGILKSLPVKLTLSFTHHAVNRLADITKENLLHIIQHFVHV